jgi:hypothetical protein
LRAVQDRFEDADNDPPPIRYGMIRQKQSDSAAQTQVPDQYHTFGKACTAGSPGVLVPQRQMLM